MKVFFKYLLVGALFIIVSCNDERQNVLEYPHYDINLLVKPSSGFINVDGIMYMADNQPLKDSLFFYLDRGMKIESFVLNEKIKLYPDSVDSDNRFMPKAMKMKTGSKAEYEKNGNIISFKYQGKLSELPPYFANTISNVWTEIGMYYPWFPYNPEMKLYTYKVNITTDEQYTVFGIGNITRKENIVTLETHNPTNDIVICLSDNVIKEQFLAGNTKINLYQHNLADSVVDKIQNDLTGIIISLNAWYGDKEQEITLVQSKRESGGGYARIGGVFLGGFNPDQYYEYNESYHRYLAHELAHLWWYKAQTNSWEDWLNEGFAEHSGLMVVREVFGEEAFKNRMDTKKESIKDTPPLWEFERNNTSTEEAAKIVELLLYSKAPVLLSELENRIGKEPFIEFTGLLLKNNANTTRQFPDVLEEAEGKEVATWFTDMLQTF